MQTDEAFITTELNPSNSTNKSAQFPASTPDSETVEPASFAAQTLRQKSSNTLDVPPSPTVPFEDHDRRSPSPTSIFSAHSSRSVRWARGTTFVENMRGHSSYRPTFQSQLRRRNSNATLASSLPSVHDAEHSNWISDDEDSDDFHSPGLVLASSRSGMASSLFSPTRTCVGSSTDVEQSRPTSFLKKYSPFRRSSRSSFYIDNTQDASFADDDPHVSISDVHEEEVAVADIGKRDGEVVVRKESPFTRLLFLVKRRRTTYARA